VLTLLTGFTYATSVIMLGVSGTGAIALAILTALMTWLVAPLLERVFDTWRSPLTTLLPLAVVLALIGVLTVKQTAEHPARSSLVYAENADSGVAFLGSYSSRERWTSSVLGPVAKGPRWTSALSESGQALYGHPVPRTTLDAPTLTFIRDTIIDNARRVIVRLNAPRGTTGVVVRVLGTHVERAAIDARVVDTTRFRYRPTEWVTQFWNVPDSGAVFSLAVPPSKRLELEVAARRPGLPGGLIVSPRPDNVVPSQSGDVSIVYRRASF
jgi:hypothetical protein